MSCIYMYLKQHDQQLFHMWKRLTRNTYPSIIKFICALQYYSFIAFYVVQYKSTLVNLKLCNRFPLNIHAKFQITFSAKSWFTLYNNPALKSIFNSFFSGKYNFWHTRIKVYSLRRVHDNCRVTADFLR